MQTKHIEITLQEAKELYQNNESFRPKLLKEFGEKMLLELNVPSLEEAKALYSKPFPAKSCSMHEAFVNLLLLKEVLGEHCSVDWNNPNSIKFCIGRKNNVITICTSYNDYYFLAFNSPSIAKEFLEKHEQLISVFLD